MSERRSDDRVPVDSAIEVIDLGADRRIGILANISLHGFMLMGDQPCSEERLYQLRIKVPQSGGPPRHIEVGAESHWCQQVEEGGRCWIGFGILDISEEDAEFIEGLIGQWS